MCGLTNRPASAEIDVGEEGGVGDEGFRGKAVPGAGVRSFSHISDRNLP